MTTANKCLLLVLLMAAMILLPSLMLAQAPVSDDTWTVAGGGNNGRAATLNVQDPDAVTWIRFDLGDEWGTTIQSSMIQKATLKVFLAAVTKSGTFNVCRVTRSWSEATLTEFVRHLETYLPLFRQLSAFRFLYLARVDSHFEKAKALFDSLVAIPLGSDVSADLLRYFQIRKAWDLARYTSLSEADLIFRNEAKTRFGGLRFEHLYRGWKAARVSESDIRQEFGGGNRHATVHFAAEVLRPFAVPEQEPEGKT